MKYIIYLSIFVAILFTACQKHDISLDHDTAKDGLPTLGLSVTLSAPTRSDTSDPNENWESGVDLENKIDIDGNDYAIYFFDADNKYLATFHPSQQPIVASSLDNSLSTVTYNIVGAVPIEVGIEFKLLILANWKHKYPLERGLSSGSDAYELIKGKTTIKDICTHAEAQFNALSTPNENEDWLGPERYIPFYGVRHYNLGDSQIFPDLQQFIEDGRIKKKIFVDLKDYAIPLIRAMARIEVILDNSFASFSSVKLTRSNQTGYCAPYSGNDDEWIWDYSDYFHNYDYDLDFVHDVHIPSDNFNSTEQNPLLFKKVSARSENSLERWVAYVPEYLNKESSSPCEIEVTLANPNNSEDSLNDSDFPSGTNSWSNPTKKIFFKRYADGNPTNDVINIERNNIYRFIVIGMSTQLNCKVDIQPYSMEELTFKFGLMRDERGDLMVLPTYNLEDDLDSYKNTLPDYFINNGKWPKVMKVNDDGQLEATEQELRPEMKGDYYAIVVNDYDEMSKAEIWLKDKDGCRVLTPMGDVNDDHCRARSVVEFFGLNDKIIYDKDIYGERRVFHFDSGELEHWSIVINPDDNKMYFRSGTDPSIRYLVESWDGDTLWYRFAFIGSAFIADEDNIREYLGLSDDEPLPEEYLSLIGKKVRKAKYIQIDNQGNNQNEKILIDEVSEDSIEG